MRIRALLYYTISLLLTVLTVSGCAQEQEAGNETHSMPAMSTEEHARALAQRLIIVDGHVDVPYRMGEYVEGLDTLTRGGDFDAPRARAGGLNAPLMSIYIPASYQNGGAKAFADNLIDMVEGFVAKWPGDFAIATTPDDIQQQFAAGKISLPMGMENGAPIEGKLDNLRHFYQRGIRYITLTHSKNNHICDSSYDPDRTWNGLSPFGRQVVAEMNRLGIMIDISHVSDSTFYQVMRLSRAPVIASHSSCRHFTPGWERNISDDMLRQLAQNGGVIMINFGSSFLKAEYQQQDRQLERRLSADLQQQGIKQGTAAAWLYGVAFRRANPVGTVDDVVDHINHVVSVAGIDHAGLGSDFDGVFTLPAGLQDVAGYPNLIAKLLERGYSEEAIAKICSGNILRVWRSVEQTAQMLQSTE